jgi:hypothetical protein
MDSGGPCHDEYASDSNPLKCHCHSFAIAVLRHLLCLRAEEMEHRIGHLAAMSKKAGQVGRWVLTAFRSRLGSFGMCITG